MPEQSFTEKVEAEVIKASKPDGSPAMVPFKAVPRRRRGELMRRFAVVNDRKAEISGMSGEGGLTPDQAAVALDFMADIEDMLAEAADDRAVFTEWAASCDDADLIALLTWYVTTFQVGE